MSASMLHEMHVKQTKWFIDQNPIEVELTRHTKVKTPSGGYTMTTKKLWPQTMRLVGSNLVGATNQDLSAEGEVVVPQYSLVALPNADIRKDDTFVHGEHTFEVVHVQDTPPWRLNVSVVRRG